MTETPVPLTLISGFIGAGKSTLLKQLVENKAGLKVGILVESVEEVSIDEALVSKKSTSAIGDTVELQNGCACSSAAQDFAEGVKQLMTLAKERGVPWDHIVIESSGVAEPREVRAGVRSAFGSRPQLLQGTKLHTMVTVLDGSTFLLEYEKRNKLQERSDLGTSESVDSGRQVVDLMCEQIECADVLIVTKADLLKEDEMGLLRETVSAISPGAQLHTSEQKAVHGTGRVELAQVLGAVRGVGVADMDEDGEHRRTVALVKASEQAEQARAAANGHAGDDAKMAEAGAAADGDAAGAPPAPAPAPSGKRFGISSFCYQRRRPFHPHRLMSVIRELPVRLESLALSEALLKDKESDAPLGESRSPMRSLIRAKGFIWLSNSHSQIFYWALAGKHFELKQYATWWGSLPRDEWPKEPTAVAEILKDFDEEAVVADRRQELILVGVGMDADGITKLLDGCLLTDSEMAEYKRRERSLEDVHDTATSA